MILISLKTITDKTYRLKKTTDKVLIYMLYKMLFLMSDNMAKNSLVARKTASSIMNIGGIKKVIDLDFYDSFYIGGLWTGTLTTTILDQKKLKAFEQEVTEKYAWPVERVFSGFSINNSIIDKQQKTFEVFLKYFPDFTGEPPFFRDEYATYGYDDDAIFINNERQYYRLLNEFEGDWFVKNGYSEVSMFNLSHRIVSPENIIGKHWVVVLTCHR